MKTKTILLMALAALLWTAASAQQTGFPRAKMTALVVDENDRPVAGAAVRVFFVQQFTRDQSMVTGLTDDKGEFAAEGYSEAALNADASKDGYYVSGALPFLFKEIVDGKLQPWNPVSRIVLRPIRKPVPLAAKRVQTQVPVLDEPCGYDLEKGDWVAPHGKGTKADFTFTVHRDFKDWFNFTVDTQVTFAQPLDGLVRMTSPAVGHYSVFRWERSAPEAGFKAPHLIRFTNHDPRSGAAPEKTFDTTKRDQGYFFRVRTVEQDGRIVAANYGKIVGDIGIDPRDSKTCSISFTYYFNPTSLDRNLEWDPKRNLIPGLSFDETPRDP